MTKRSSLLVCSVVNSFLLTGTIARHLARVPGLSQATRCFGRVPIEWQSGQRVTYYTQHPKGKSYRGKNAGFHLPTNADKLRVGAYVHIGTRHHLPMESYIREGLNGLF